MSSVKARWESLLNTSTNPQVRSEVMSLQMAYAKVSQDFEAAPKEVKAIDFNSYKAKVRDHVLINDIEKAYKAIKYPKNTLQPNQADDADVKALLESAKDLTESSSKKAKELETLLATLLKSRTSKDTTIDDVAKLYPEIEAEIQKDLKNNEWGKGL